MPAAPTPSATMLDDLRAGVRLHRLWRFMAWRELDRQFARTAIGVTWIPLTVVLHVAILGAVFSLVFDGGRGYVAYFAIGYAIWKPVGQILGLAAGLWPASEKYVKHLPAPTSLFVIKTVYKAALIFAMCLPVGVVVAVIAGARPGWGALAAVPGVALFLANVTWVTVALSVVALRYRDLRGFVPSALFIIYLCTPILWQRERLGAHGWIADVNPLFHVISLVREPLLGHPTAWLSWAVASTAAVGGNLAAWSVLGAVRRRIPLWL